MNGGLRAHDPFAVDEDRWLEALARDWGHVFLTSVNEGRWFAVRRDGSGDALIAATPGKLATAMATAGNAPVQAMTPHEALVLQGLAEQWAGIFTVGYACGVFTARRRDDGDDVPPIAAGTLEGLSSAMRSAFYRQVTR